MILLLSDPLRRLYGGRSCANQLRFCGGHSDRPFRRHYSGRHSGIEEYGNECNPDRGNGCIW